MSFITHHIPWFLRQPAEAIIGEKCYTTLIHDFDVLDGPCLKYALSKGLGLGIVLGGAIVKIPQILKITSTQSAHGLSLPSYLLETLGYAISLSYAFRSRFPFSTYGENAFMTVQNVIITLLILQYGAAEGKRTLSRGERGPGGKVALAAGAIGLIGWLLADSRILPFSALTVLQACTVPISLLSKAPQILSNHRLKSTGNLSAFAVFNALLGCLARIFTTFTEVDDKLVLWGFALAAALNAVLAGQMLLYWNNGHSSFSSSSLPSSTSFGAGGEKERLREESEMGGVGSPTSAGRRPWGGAGKGKDE